ncbi:hypothetical protein Pelo_16580 [Pelomyxa schiedti]|nr:hypothetical protein Pelo_16580 [Pelomyxa schiedti]
MLICDFLSILVCGHIISPAGNPDATPPGLSRSKSPNPIQSTNEQAHADGVRGHSRPDVVVGAQEQRGLRPHAVDGRVRGRAPLHPLGVAADALRGALRAVLLASHNVHPAVVSPDLPAELAAVGVAPAPDQVVAADAVLRAERGADAEAVVPRRVHWELLRGSGVLT